MNDVILLTTPLVEGMPIEKYYGLVSANQVAGTGFLTDLTASFSDFFGGNSGTYRNAMDELCKDVTDRLKLKASYMGANAVIGVTIDYDSISAKNMSMFMVSIQGTAVKLATPNIDNQIIAENEVSWETVNSMFFKKKILRKLNENTPLSDDDWSVINKYKASDLLEPLYNYYSKCRELEKEAKADTIYINKIVDNWVVSGISYFKQYVSSLDYKDAIKYVYKDVGAFEEIINKNKLFNAAKILELANQGKLDIAISLLHVEKTSYNDSDLSDMKSLCKFFKNLPEVGCKTEIINSLFSSGGLKYICSCGRKNEPDIEYCTECGKNIYGITKEQKQKIDEFVDLVDTLDELIKE